MLIPKAHYEAVGEPEFAKSPVGSGPYTFGDQVLGASVQVESINRPHFRGGIPKYETITFLGVSEETTRIAMIKSGQADVIDTSRERVASLADDGFNIFYKERADLMGAYFFQQWEEGNPFKDVKVREALNKAINRDAILEHIYLGKGSTTLYPMGSYAAASGYDPSLSSYPYDPDLASQLLVDAGYTEDNPLEIKLAIYPFGGIAEFPRMIEAIGADFEAVGIKVNFQPTEYGTLRNMRRARELGGGWIGPWGTPTGRRRRRFSASSGGWSIPRLLTPPTRTRTLMSFWKQPMPRRTWKKSRTSSARCSGSCTPTTMEYRCSKWTLPSPPSRR